MKINLVVFLLIVINSIGIYGKTPFVIKDIYRIKYLSDPHISPNGKQVAFVVKEFFLEEGEYNNEIYIMNMDGSCLRQLTHHDGIDYHPRWSPNGKELLFVSDRSGKDQIWVLPLDGGDPRQLTFINTDVTNPEWSSDGKFIAFSSKVFPECGADDECNDKINTSMGEGPLQAHMADKLLYRHWNFWKDGKRTHIMLYHVKTGEISDLTPDDYNSPSFSLAGATGFDFSPDGKEVCFVSQRDNKEAETTNKDLWLVSITGGEAKNITDENEAYDGEPHYSPDNRYIAYRMQKVPVFEADKFRLAIYDRQTGTKKILTENFDYWVNDFIKFGFS